MAIEILSTKLHGPAVRPETIPRPNLIEQLNEGLYRKLTLISAPAGFGKTTLVSEWTTSCDRPIAWLSLDERDKDLTRFLKCLVAALQTIITDIGGSVLGMLQSPQLPPAESTLTVLINEITNVPKKLILVLDDFHLVEAKPVDDALTFLLEHLPQQVHLVIATREDPHLPLNRLRSRDQLTELRANDLRFNPSEATDFLNNVMGLSLSAEEITTLETRTEGWITGLQLAAVSMRGCHDISSFLKSFTGSHRFVLDYLIEEVLHQQPADIQAFLLRTSILDRMCSSLCDAVSLDSATPGKETLEYLEHSNLFVIPLDNERRWYRYHHLFADLLQQRLHQSTAISAGNTVSLAELHSRASKWYENNDHLIEAIHHAAYAKDFKRTAKLVEFAWPEMERSFQTGTWLGLVNLIPDAMVRVRPVLSAALGLALISNGHHEACDARLRDAERWLDTARKASEGQIIPSSEMVVADEEQFQALPASIAITRVYQAGAYNDLSGAVIYAQQALDLLPLEDHTRRSVVTGLLACSYWANGDLETAFQTFIKIKADHETVGNTHYAVAITIGLAAIKVAQGQLQTAKDLYEQSIKTASEHDESLYAVVADLYLGWSMIVLEQNDLKTAEQYLLKSKELGDQAELTDWRYRWYIAQARLKEAQGNLDLALDLLHKAERLFFKTPRPNLQPIAALKASVWINLDRLAEAQDWAQDQGLFGNNDLSYLKEFEHITLARLFIAQFRINPSDSSILEVTGLLDRLLKEAEDGGRVGSMIEILTVQSLAYKAQDDIPSALISLHHALTLAKPEGYIRIFINEGIPLAQLLSEAASQGIIPDYINKLLVIIETDVLKNKNKSCQPSGLSALPLIEPLSRRELEVLQLITLGLSNREISDRLFLALTTVKGHNSNIFGKLQVKSRTEAIARAHELGLFQQI